MVAPCVGRLQQEITDSPDAIERAELTAELGCYLARVGEFDRVEIMISNLRRDFGDGSNVRISILIMCMEGLLHHFRDLSDKSLDRLYRARLISASTKQRDLLCLTSAWLAHMYFNSNRFEEAVSSLFGALETLDKTNISSICRIGMVAGDIFNCIGEDAPSRDWYDISRHAATAYGDQASIGALTYNTAALHIFSLRLRSHFSRVSEIEIESATTRIRTAENYQLIAELKSLDHLLVGSNIHLEMLRQNFALAYELIMNILKAGTVPAHYQHLLVFRLDKALCEAKLGREQAAIECLLEVDIDILSKLSIDDKIIAFSTLERIGECIESDALDRFSAIDLKRALVEHEELNRKVKEAMDPFRLIPSWLQSAH